MRLVHVRYSIGLIHWATRETMQILENYVSILRNHYGQGCTQDVGTFCPSILCKHELFSLYSISFLFVLYFSSNLRLQVQLICKSNRLRNIELHIPFICTSLLFVQGWALHTYMWGYLYLCPPLNMCVGPFAFCHKQYVYILQ